MLKVEYFKESLNECHILLRLVIRLEHELILVLSHCLILEMKKNSSLQSLLFNVSSSELLAKSENGCKISFVLSFVICYSWNSFISFLISSLMSGSLMQFFSPCVSGKYLNKLFVMCFKCDVDDSNSEHKFKSLMGYDAQSIDLIASFNSFMLFLAISGSDKARE